MDHDHYVMIYTNSVESFFLSPPSKIFWGEMNKAKVGIFFRERGLEGPRAFVTEINTSVS